MNDAKKLLLTKRISGKKTVFEEETEKLKRIMRHNVDEDYYKNHPLLANKDQEYIENVLILDQNTSIISVADCTSFGALAQREAGILLNNTGEMLAKATNLPIVSLVAEILSQIQKVETLKNETKKKKVLFFSKSVSISLGEYLEKLEEVNESAKEISEKITTSMVVASPFYKQLENLMQNTDILMLRLDQALIVGHMQMERFRPSNEAERLLYETFEKRMGDLLTFKQFVQISIAQTRITYQNSVTTVVEAISVLNTTLPVWRQMVSSNIIKWRKSGASDDTPIDQIDDIMKSDLTFESVEQH
jgi:hypothetical protein